MRASPWTRIYSDAHSSFAHVRNLNAEPIALILDPIHPGGPWRTLYREGGVWRTGTAVEDLTGAARAMNARVRSMGIGCDDGVPS